MIVFGIDPGFGRCGWGVIKKEGQKDVLIDYGCIETSPSVDFPDRLMQIHAELTELFKKYSPDLVGVEKLFFSKNTKTALDVGQARGVILLSIKQAGYNLLELTPNEIKLAVTGQGNADKLQMQQMVKILLSLKEIPKPDDAADALAVAIASSSWKQFDR